MVEVMLLGLGLLSAAGLVLALGRRQRQAAQRAGQVLLQATEAGDIVQMQALLAKGAEVNARNAHGWTPLHVAAAGGDPAVIALLLQHGADVHAQSHIGTTPLDNATTRGGRKAVITLLLAHGAKCNGAWDEPF
jgi:ankyrin repeat protein